MNAPRPPVRALTVATAIALAVTVASGAAASDPPAPAARGTAAEAPDRPAIISRHASRSLLLGAAWAGSRLVVVGERGIVLFSDDNAATWTQGQVPVSVTLTAVHFVDQKVGWAVGHFGMVLKTTDGGLTWTKQLDGNRAAKIAFDAAKALADAAPDDVKLQRALNEAQGLVDAGPDKPFLDVFFDDANHGFVVGAYNLAFRTDDGGQTWVSWMDRVPNPGATHLYAITHAHGNVYLAGEQGLFLKSTDGGQHFAKIDTPYNGSYFTQAALPGGELVIAGLRGTIYVTPDQGATWRKVEGVPPVNITAAVVTPQGLLLSNFGGEVWSSTDGAASFRPIPEIHLPPIARIVPLPDGGLLALTLQGAIKLPGSSAPHAAPAGGSR